MIIKVHKWGNGLGIRLPSDAIDKLSLSSSSSLEFIIEGESITLRPKEVGLTDMLSFVDQGKTKYTSWDKSVIKGREIW